MRSFSLLLLVGVGVTAAHAQTTVSLGPRLGGNSSNATFSLIDESAAGPGFSSNYTRRSLWGFQVGLAASISSPQGHWAFQPALLLTQKGLRQNIAESYSSGNGLGYQVDGHIESRVNYLELPLNLVYGLEPGGEGIQLFAGPYLAAGVGGKASYAYSLTSNDPSFAGSYSGSGSQPFAFGDTFVEPDPNNNNAVADARVRRFDAGLNAGIGYRRGPLQVQLGYGLGLVNAQPDYPSGYGSSATQIKGYNRTAQLTATYYFPMVGK